MTDIIVNGAEGAWATSSSEEEASSDFRLAAGVDILGATDIFRSLTELNCRADVLIDFSTRTAAYDVIKLCRVEKNSAGNMHNRLSKRGAKSL